MTAAVLRQWSGLITLLPAGVECKCPILPRWARLRFMESAIKMTHAKGTHMESCLGGCLIKSLFHHNLHRFPCKATQVEALGWCQLSLQTGPHLSSSWAVIGKHLLQENARAAMASNIISACTNSALGVSLKGKERNTNFNILRP